MDRTAVFAATGVALFFAHQVGDHWVQREESARDKGLPGWRGRAACAEHVLTYSLTALLFLSVAYWVCGASPSIWRFVAGLGVSAVTHYVADRRVPLRKLAERLGHREFYRLGAPREGQDDNPSLGTGAYALDQSYHYLFLFVAALVIAS